jgi:hypothetical protein
MTIRRYAYTATRRSRPRWLPPLVILAVFCCTPRQTESALELAATDRTDRVRIFLIAPGDAGALGLKIGCDDSAVPVEVDLPRREPALEGSLQALLSLGDSRHEASGLYNALYASPLKVTAIQRVGTEARIRLAGYLEIGGDCDGPRILAQLTETALQFPDIQRVTFYLEDTPLRTLLSGKG